MSVDQAVAAMESGLELIRGTTVDIWKEVDVEKAVLSLSLFLFALIVFSPRHSLRRNKWGSSLGSDKEKVQLTAGSKGSNISDQQNEEPRFEGSTRTSSASNSSATLCTGQVLGLDEDESAEEQFEKAWPTIRISPYRRLVLPPECKLLDKPSRTKLKVTTEEKSAAKQSDEDDENPARRLQLYARHLLLLLRSIASYDYFGACWTVIEWLQAWMRLRSRNSSRRDEDDDFEDEDDIRKDDDIMDAKASLGLMEFSDEEKKEEVSGARTELLRNASLHYMSASEIGESDTEENLPRKPLTAAPQIEETVNALKVFRDDPTVGGATTPPASIPPLAIGAAAPSEGVPKKVERSATERLSFFFFDAAHSRSSLKRLHVEVPVPDRNGYIMGDEFLPSTRQTPLLVFVNSRSGPQQGHLLITQLRRLLNPIQVWDLADGGPEKVLESFCVFARLRILVCGGDGTVSWIISTLEDMQVERWPPIAILPLGTGNDLARVHGWGGGYNHESLISLLEQVSDAYISLLDRWEMTIENRHGRIVERKSFFNYLGVGVDAQAALQVHMLRQSKPKLFFSRAVNKAWYAVFGAEDAIKASHANLPNEITLMADGVEVALPPDVQGIILLNIDSYGGGVPMWSHGINANIPDPTVGAETSVGNRRPSPRRVQSLGSFPKMKPPAANSRFYRVDSMDDLNFGGVYNEDANYSSCDRPSSFQDGKLDLVAVRGTFHLGQIRVGLSNALKLCQAKEITITLKKKMAVQIDGEPWRQKACTLRVKRKKDPVMMLHRSADESGGVETEMAKLLDWAEDRKIIDRDVHSVLMKEFSRRIESKTRQRKVKTQDNFMVSLKRAIASSNQIQGSFPSNLSF